jgi:hypothetical protein
MLVAIEVIVTSVVFKVVRPLTVAFLAVHLPHGFK